MEREEMLALLDFLTGQCKRLEGGDESRQWRHADAAWAVVYNRLYGRNLPVFWDGVRVA